MEPLRIAVTGVGVLAPTGTTTAAFTASLAEDRSAIVVSDDGFLRAPVPDFAPRRFIAPGSLRRMPRLVQMTIVAAKHALADAAGIAIPAEGEPPAALRTPAEALGLDPARVGVVFGTGLGAFDQTMEFLGGYLDGGPEAASPLLFPTSVMNAAAGLLSVECGLRGVNTTVNHKDGSPLLAICMAIDQLRMGRADAIVVGATDELCAPIFEGYRLLGGLTRTEMKPYDRARSGLGLGESAALVVLERLDDARRRGRRIRAVLGPRAETSEDRPRVGWAEGQPMSEATRAVREVLAATARTIDWIAGSGNGTRLDELELGALAAAFAEAGRPMPPISSILSQTGESAASALLRLCAAVNAIEHGLIPGTTGLETPIAGGDTLLRSARRQPVSTVLVPSFAQGGSNVALVVERD